MEPLLTKQLAEEYIAWMRSRRTEAFSQRQEQILRKDVLPTIGDIPIGDVLSNALRGTTSFSSLKPKERRKALVVHNIVSAMVSWKLKQLARAGGARWK